MKTIHRAKKVLAVCFAMCVFLIVAQAQTTTLTLKNGRATVKRAFQPRREADAHLYDLKLRAGQMVEIKVVSNSVRLSEENECGIFFDLFDSNGKQIFLGDAPDGIDHWEGEIKATGNYQIKVYMGCLEGFTTADLRKKKPAFKYSLQIQVKR